MSYLPSVQPGGGLASLLLQFPDRYRPLPAYIEVVMRGPSPLTPADGS